MSKHDVSAIEAITTHFCELVRECVSTYSGVKIILPPPIEEPLPSFNTKAWFPVPGMCGGFSYWFEEDGESPVLIVESWSRVVQGSGQRHEVTQDGTRLLDEGFV